MLCSMCTSATLTNELHASNPIYVSIIFSFVFPTLETDKTHLGLRIN